jgi:hypothetical protein
MRKKGNNIAAAALQIVFPNEFNSNKLKWKMFIKKQK